MFLMYRVELKENVANSLIALSDRFLMYRVELKAMLLSIFGRVGQGS